MKNEHKMILISVGVLVLGLLIFALTRPSEKADQSSQVVEGQSEKQNESPSVGNTEEPSEQASNSKKVKEQKPVENNKKKPPSIKKTNNKQDEQEELTRKEEELENKKREKERLKEESLSKELGSLSVLVRSFKTYAQCGRGSIRRIVLKNRAYL